MRRMSAPDCLITSCGAVTLPSDFDILRPSSSSTKPCVSTTSKGARARVPQDSSSEDWNQPRCWSEPSRYITVSGPPSRLRLIPASEGKCAGSSKTKAWVEPESNQTSRMSSTFCQSSLASSPRKRSRARVVPGGGRFALEGPGDAALGPAGREGPGRPRRPPPHEDRERNPPGAPARGPPVRPALDHAANAVLALLGHPAGDRNRGK